MSEIKLNLGVDNKFLIAPSNNVILGNVHGYRENICHRDKSSPTKARECYRLGKYNFKAGQAIDFTWGMRSRRQIRTRYHTGGIEVDFNWVQNACLLFPC